MAKNAKSGLETENKAPRKAADSVNDQGRSRFSASISRFRKDLNGPFTCVLEVSGAAFFNFLIKISSIGEQLILDYDQSIRRAAKRFPPTRFYRISSPAIPGIP